MGCFSQETPLLGVTEISRALGVPKSAVSRVLRTLEQTRFLERDHMNHKYKPSVRAFLFGSLYRCTDPIFQRAWAALRDLVQLTGHNGYLATLLGGEVLCPCAS
jgi:DNA-binding IclR family transcriptional regulator